MQACLTVMAVRLFSRAEKNCINLFNYLIKINPNISIGTVAILKIRVYNVVS